MKAHLSIYRARLPHPRQDAAERDAAVVMLTLRQPVGPVTLITRELPFAIPVWKTAPALVAGCTVS